MENRSNVQPPSPSELSGPLPPREPKKDRFYMVLGVIAILAVIWWFFFRPVANYAPVEPFIDAIPAVNQPAAGEFLTEVIGGVDLQYGVNRIVYSETGDTVFIIKDERGIAVIEPNRDILEDIVTRLEKIEGKLDDQAP